MMDWTDRHCRFFLRQISRHARLYTEMITAPALLHGDVPRHLDFDPAEHPLALQLGGSDPVLLAHAAKLGERWGYDEINLNCGCPSERVQTGSFGACLMREPELVAQCVRAMRDAVALPVTVKHRIGLDADEEYGLVRDFVGAVADAGCDVFIVHARNAVLKGLSPKENREVPRLRYDVVHRLKREFPGRTFVLNGGLTTWTAIERELELVDGVMLGRAAYHNPMLLAEVDARFFGGAPVDVDAAVEAYVEHVAWQLTLGARLHPLIKPMLGLYTGRPGARLFRRHLSEQAPRDGAGIAVLRDALSFVRERRAA